MLQEKMEPEKLQQLEIHVKAILELLGEETERNGLLGTPNRVARSLEFLTSGYRTDIKDIVRDGIFMEIENNEMVILKEIELYSLCEHHMLPFVGKCHVGYIPDGKIIGVSKIARIVDLYARRLQVQERLTNQIANTLQSILNPLGVAVVIEAQHLCMMMRGVEKQNSVMVTSRMIGAFQKRTDTRMEFMNLIHSHRK